MRGLWLLLALGGCSAGVAPAPQAASAEQFCADVAAHDPVVKALILRSLSDPSFFSYAPAQIAAAKASIAADCLRRQGIAPTSTGVQAPQPTGTLLP